MEKITIGEILAFGGGLVAIITTIEFLFVRFKKWFSILFDKETKVLKSTIEEETLQRCKYDLITTMSRIQNGYIPTLEEKRMLIETKEVYNKKGGDGYVDNMFDNLKKEGLI